MQLPPRPRLTPGIVYERWVPELNAQIQLELFDLDRHLDVFYEWHQEVRVYRFWELNHSKPELETYILKALADPHQDPLILSVNGEPAGYFEIYWTAEDRLAPYYDYDIYDRGIHLLIGGRSFLGRNYFHAFMQSVLHFLFMSEPRTTRIMAEPRVDNSVLFQYLKTMPYWQKLYEFDFPHKKAALLQCLRSDFSQLGLELC